MEKVLLKCGHSANAIQKLPDGSEVPACVICGCNEVVDAPDLTGRKARCDYYGSKCRSEVDSRLDLPFFEHKPNNKYDEYYCGCYGWN